MKKCEICGRELADEEVCDCANKNEEIIDKVKETEDENVKENVTESTDNATKENIADTEDASAKENNTDSADESVKEDTTESSDNSVKEDISDSPEAVVNVVSEDNAVESISETVKDIVTVTDESTITDLPDNKNSDMNDYFKITIDKDRVSETVQAAKNLIGDKRYNEGECIVHTADSEYEDGMRVIDHCVVAAEEETPVKQYDFAYMRTPFLKKAFGRLQVTTKRVIYRAAGKSISGPVLVEKEFDIKEIGGVEIKSDYRFSIIQYIISLFVTYFITLCCVFPSYVWINGRHETNALPILCMIIYTIAEIYMMLFVKKRRRVKSAFAFSIGIIAFLMMTKGMLIGAGKSAFLTFIMVAGCLFSLIMSIFAGIVDDLHLILKVNGASEAFEVARKLLKDERSGFWFVKPWKDTEIAIRELGAMIDDFNRLSTEKALEKWLDC